MASYFEPYAADTQSAAVAFSKISTSLFLQMVFLDCDVLLSSNDKVSNCVGKCIFKYIMETYTGLSYNFF